MDRASQQRGLNAGRLHCRRVSGFTLMELLVVIGIALLLAAVAVPSIGRLTAGNNQKQAVNMINAYLSSARALAVGQRKQVAVVLYEEDANNPVYGSNAVNSRQTAITLAQEVATDSTSASSITYFAQVPNRTPAYLPVGIKVATLDDSANGMHIGKASAWNTGTSYAVGDSVTVTEGVSPYTGTMSGTYKCIAANSSSTSNQPPSSSYWAPSRPTRAIVFDATGQMVARAKLGTRPITFPASISGTKPVKVGDSVYYAGKCYSCIQAHNASTANPPNTATAYWSEWPISYSAVSLDWRMSAQYDFFSGSPSTTYTGSYYTSSPALLVYDDRNFSSLTFADEAAASAWLQQNSDIVVVNAYTGNVIR